MTSCGKNIQWWYLEWISRASFLDQEEALNWFFSWLILLYHFAVLGNSWYFS